MNIEYIDTIKINELSSDMLEELKIYKENIDYLYDRINNMNTKTLEWIGNGSLEFIDKFNSDYKEFTDLYDSLRNYFIFLGDISKSVDDIFKGNND